MIVEKVKNSKIEMNNWWVMKMGYLLIEGSFYPCRLQTTTQGSIVQGVKD